jgi:hypothetical protein
MSSKSAQEVEVLLPVARSPSNASAKSQASNKSSKSIQFSVVPVARSRSNTSTKSQASNKSSKSIQFSVVSVARSRSSASTKSQASKVSSKSAQEVEVPVTAEESSICNSCKSTESLDAQVVADENVTKVEVKPEVEVGPVPVCAACDADTTSKVESIWFDVKSFFTKKMKQMKNKKGSILLNSTRIDGCNHGYIATEDHFFIKDFAETFTAGFIGEEDLGASITAACKAISQKYPERGCGDASKLKQVVSFYLFNGTQEVLDGDLRSARTYACMACFVEDCIAVGLHKNRATYDGTKLVESLWSADEHTLVEHLRKNVRCNCLDGKYGTKKSNP